MPNNSLMKSAAATASCLATHLTRALPNHVHRFDSLQCPPRRRERTVALGQPGPFLYRAVVLFHYIVEILALAQTDTTRQNPFRFQLFHRRRKGWVLVHIDDSRHCIPGRTQSLTEEAFSGRSIALGGEQKIDCLTGGIYGTVEELVLTFCLYICFVSAVTFVRGLQMWPAAFVQFGCVGLDPAPDATWIHLHTAFRQKFGHVLVGQGISEVPADAQNNHLTREVTAFEGIGRGDRHGFLQ